MTNLNYGVIGNGQSAALISETGTIAWCCLPVFDSASVFARILDRDRGGHFGVRMEGQTRVSQRYLPHTNILVTTFRGEVDAFEVIDFMPRHKDDDGTYHCPPDVVRILRPVSGSPVVVFDYAPRLAYAQPETRTENVGPYLKSVTLGQPYESVYLYSDLDLDALCEGKPIALRGDHFVCLSYNEKVDVPNRLSVDLAFELTKQYWMNWSADSRSFGRWSEVIERSALVLKLLAHQKTGAVLAALTTSLPEDPGGERNWDYRYCWLRDASMVVKVFTQLRHYRVGSRYLQFILDVIPYKDEKVQIMYGIDRRRTLTEREMPWLAGYEDSKPVRVGNAAYKQKQNDIYGLVMDTIHQRLLDHPESVENLDGVWTVVRSLVRNVEQNWSKKDAGIWEIRGHKKNFVFSKVLCWVAIDRAIAIASSIGQDRYVEGWSALRDKIQVDVFRRGWSDAEGSFKQSYEDDHVDAANLLMEHYGFIDADDPRYVSTVERTYELLCRDGMMYRYRNEDDFGTPKSSFIVCTFWMIKSLHRVGRTQLAREMFEGMLSHSNHLGLFSEGMQFASHRLVGNFPQGYSHLALIDTALALMDGDGR